MDTELHFYGSLFRALFRAHLRVAHWG